MNAAAIEVKPQDTEKQPALVPVLDKSKRKPGPKAKKGSDEAFRYFLAKEGSHDGMPELGEEVKSESEALIRSFKSPNPLFFRVAAFRADIEMNGGTPTIVKRSA
jgi:hypothetical protein